MADTLPNVPLDKGVWINLYNETSIAVGTKISVQNLGNSTIQLSVKENEPLATDGFVELSQGNDVYSNDAADSGAWARSLVINGLINVRIT